MKKVDWVERWFQIAAGLNGLAVLVVLAVYSYGGWFSRLRADDYCQSVYLLTARNFLDATIKAYDSWLGRYSIVSFVQLTEWVGAWGPRLMAGVILSMWLIFLTWLISEIGKTIRIHFQFITSLWIAGLIIFLSLYQSTVLYQLLYWRATLPYTIPLAFFVGIAAFILRYMRLPYQKSRALWTGALAALLVFYAGGFGESTGALQVGILLVAVLVVWLTGLGGQRKDILSILITLLGIAMISVLVIGLSPGTSVRLNAIMTRSTVYNPIELSRDVVVFTFQFLVNVFRTSPIPNLIALFVSLLAIYFISSNANEDVSRISSTHIRTALLMIPLIMFFIGGCSFAPSAFVRTFPLGRVRFAAQFALTLCLVIEGGLLGILSKRIKLPLQVNVLRVLIVALLAVFALYPLQASSKIYASLAQYRNFAAAWDERDVQIRQAVAEGKQDVVVVQLDSVGDVGEYKGFGGPNYWINVCAADYYGLHTLVAP